MARSGAELEAEIENCIRRSCHGAYPFESKLIPAYDRSACLSAIGQCLRAQYDALAPPMPPHIAELVEELETKKLGRTSKVMPLVSSNPSCVRSESRRQLIRRFSAACVLAEDLEQ